MSSGPDCEYAPCTAPARVRDADGKLWCGRSHRYEGQRVGRNDPCPCDSGKKFKACCSTIPVHVRACRMCGCTEQRACVRTTPDGTWRCRWVAPDLCSACTSGRVTMIGGGA